jgi:hypothetical protein
MAQSRCEEIARIAKRMPVHEFWQVEPRSQWHWTNARESDERPLIGSVALTVRIEREINESLDAAFFSAVASNQ